MTQKPKLSDRGVGEGLIIRQKTFFAAKKTKIAGKTGKLLNDLKKYFHMSKILKMGINRMVWCSTLRKNFVRNGSGLWPPAMTPKRGPTFSIFVILKKGRNKNWKKKHFQGTNGHYNWYICWGLLIAYVDWIILEQIKGGGKFQKLISQVVQANDQLHQRLRKRD